MLCIQLCLANLNKSVCYFLNVSKSQWQFNAFICTLQRISAVNLLVCSWLVWPFNCSPYAERHIILGTNCSIILFLPANCHLTGIDTDQGDGEEPQITKTDGAGQELSQRKLRVGRKVRQKIDARVKEGEKIGWEEKSVKYKRMGKTVV